MWMILGCWESRSWRSCIRGLTPFHCRGRNATLLEISQVCQVFTLKRKRTEFPLQSCHSGSFDCRCRYLECSRQGLFGERSCFRSSLGQTGADIGSSSRSHTAEPSTSSTHSCREPPEIGMTCPRKSLRPRPWPHLCQGPPDCSNPKRFLLLLLVLLLLLLLFLRC